MSQKHWIEDAFLVSKNLAYKDRFRGSRYPVPYIKSSFIRHNTWPLGQFPTRQDEELQHMDQHVQCLCARVFHWAMEICWRMNLQMTKATTMQSCGQTIRMGSWQWPQGIRERTRHIKVKHHHWVMPSHWKEWIGANARLSHNIVCESLQSHW